MTAPARAAFLAAAARLPFYENSATAQAFLRETEREKASAGPVPLTQLMARPDLGARDGWAPVFEITKIPKAGS